MATPKNVIIRAYQVGFGDCLLLTFVYENDAERHMLIDFGTVAWAEPKYGNKKVAESIVDKTGGKLSALVITHRHKDHISGLVGAWDTLKCLNPDVVIEPWTESPKVAKNAKSRPAKYAAALRAMHASCELAAAEAERLAVHGEACGMAGLGILAAAGDTQLATDLNKCLRGWKKARREFVCKDDPLDLKSELPGVKVRVLGPPSTIRQVGKDSAEWWPLAEGALSAGAGNKPLFPKAERYPQNQEPAETRWFRRRMAEARSDMLLEMVSLANSEVNNTSVILLIEVGGKKLLFPGDAEVECWEPALADKDLEQALSEVEVYKVGHHGSRNATPVSLWERFSHHDKKLKTILSTKQTARWKEVPRDSLLTALGKTKLVTTLDKEELYQELSVELATSD